MERKRPFHVFSVLSKDARRLRLIFIHIIKKKPLCLFRLIHVAFYYIFSNCSSVFGKKNDINFMKMYIL
jgi:hypothetical protein